MAAALVMLLPGDPAIGSHVHCGQVIDKTTRLDADLLDCPGNGVVIGADNIVLNLAGHTIDGTGSGQGVDNSGGFDHVRITGGTVKDFETGVVASESSYVRITKLAITTSGTSIRAWDCAHATIAQNDVSGVAEVLGYPPNVYYRGSGITVLHSNHTLVVDNRVRAEYRPIFVIGEDDVVKGNLVRESWFGMVIVGANRPIIERNEMLGIRNDALLVSSSRAGVISGNQAAHSEGAAINLSDTDATLVQDNASVSTDGIGIYRSYPTGGGSDENRIERNTITEGGGIDIGANDTTVIKNTIRGGSGPASLGPGINVAADRQVIRGNTVSEKETGITAQGVSDVTITGNLVSASTSSNLKFVNLNRGTVTHNRSLHSTWDGIECESCLQSSVADNEVVGSHHFGVSFVGSSGSSVERNTFTQSYGNGIDLTDSNDLVLRGNVVSHNGVGIRGNGIVVRDGSERNLLEGNLVEHNFDDGIDVFGAHNTLTGNSANYNYYWGIKATGLDTIDGGGNTATGNGEIPQCLNIACN